MPTLRGFVNVFAAVLLVLGASASAEAQEDRLPSSITGARSLSDSQQDRVDAYVQQWSGVLLEGSDREVVDARAALIQPIRSSTSDVFLDRYGRAIRKHLSAPLDAKRLITRLNAMIVASQLGGRGVHAVIVKGLGDPRSAAVRYWAVQGVLETAETQREGKSLSGNVIDDLLAGVEELLSGETSDPLLGPAMLAAVQLDDARGNTLFLDEVEAMLPRYAAEPRRPYSADLEQAWRQLIQRAMSRPQAQRDVIRRSGKLAGQYFLLIATQLANGELGVQPPQRTLNMVRFLQQSLNSATSRLDAPGTKPPSRAVETAISNANWNELAVAADRWISVLKKDPFGYSDDELALPAG